MSYNDYWISSEEMQVSLQQCIVGCFLNHVVSFMAAEKKRGGG